MPKLVIESGDKKGNVYRFSTEEVSLGRDPAKNIVVLTDRRVSRVHARIISKDKQYIIEDLGSVNGTKVNQQLIKKQTMNFGDEITVGATNIRFLSLDAAEQPAEGVMQDVNILAEQQTPQDYTVEAKITPDTIQSLDDADTDQESIKKLYQRLKTLYRISFELGTIVSLSELLDKIMELVTEIMKADRGFIMLIDEETGELGGLKGIRKRKGLEKDEISISKTIVNQVMETGESILTSDATQDMRFKEAKSIILSDTRSTMCVPIKLQDKLMGIMNIDTKGKVIAYTKDDLELLTAICNQVAIAIENAKLFDDLRNANKELKEQQAQLIEAEKLSAVGQLASGVAHEINNPMTSILGYSELSQRRLTQEKITPEDIKESAEEMQILINEAHRCQRIVQSLLQFSRRKKDEMQLTSINEVMDAALMLTKFHIKKSHVEIITQLDDDLPKVVADGNQLQQVFLNMIINARDAIGDKGSLTISGKKADDGWLEIKFIDTGSGIPEDKLDEIFKPLYTSKEEGKGTGLGLSISQDIIERHKGTIDVDSTVGKGTTFTIRLPISKEK